jgi:hypothetical protein
MSIPFKLIMARPGNIIFAAFVVVFTARELQDLGFCMSSSSALDDMIGSHHDWSGSLTKTATNGNRLSASSSPTMDASTPTIQTPPSSSHFHAAASDAYSLIHDQHDNKAGGDLPLQQQQQQQQQRTKFDVSTWKQTTTGGLVPEDREMLGRIYGNASSVFEFGLGESTYIANHVGVSRYTGIDSDPTWINMVRNNVSASYRFYFADIGMTGKWGYPKRALKKAAYNYQVVPLLGEPQPFDVYMVDGRFRVGCLIMSFLHASSSSSRRNEEIVTTHHLLTSSPTVLVHDCRRQSYRVADHLLDLVEYSGKNLCAYKRRNGTTDEQLYEVWRSEFSKVE